MIDHKEAIIEFSLLSKLFKIYYDEEVAQWKPDELPDTIAWGGFGRILVQKLDCFKHEDLIELFYKIEGFLRFGVESLSNCVSTCFIEAVIHRLNDDNEYIVRYFGDLAREYCIAYDEFTGVATPGLNLARYLPSGKV